MTGNKNQLLSFVLVVLMILGVSINPAFAYVCDNGAGTGYEEEEPSGGTSSYLSSISIESYIETGAGYFLKAKEDTDALLNMVEMQNVNGVNLTEMRNVVESALTHLTQSLDSYNSLIAKAENTAYNTAVIAELNQFDYTGFGQTHNLSGSVLSRVKNYLKNGDITGIFKRKVPIFVDMIAYLETVKNDLENGSVPGVSGLWNLNESFSDMALFGSYVARIFHQLE